MSVDGGLEKDAAIDSSLPSCLEVCGEHRPCTTVNGQLVCGEDCIDGYEEDASGDCRRAQTCASVVCGDGKQCDDESGSPVCKCIAPEVALTEGCRLPESCEDLRNAAGGHLTAGVNTIYPKVVESSIPQIENSQEVRCEAVADHMYTFLKVNMFVEDGTELGHLPSMINSSEANIKCENRGMMLFIPRSSQHFSAAHRVAMDPTFRRDLVVGAHFLKVVGVQTLGNSAWPGTDKPLQNAEDNPWKAIDQGDYFIPTDKTTSVPDGISDVQNRPENSFGAEYLGLTVNPAGEVTDIVDSHANDIAVRSAYFICMATEDD